MLFFSSSCEDKKSKVKLESQLPKAKGGFSDIIVVVDNIAWKQTLKLTFDSLLAPEVSGLYSPEPEFDLINVSHSGFKGLLKEQRIIVLVEIGPENIKSGVSYKMNQFARGQLFIKIKAVTKTEISEVIHSNRLAIFEKLNDHRMLGLRQDVLKNRNTKWSNNLLENHQLNLIIPKEYHQLKSEKGLIYFAKKAKANCENGPHLECAYQTGILIHYFPYSDEKTFTPAYILNKRDSITKIHIFGPEKKGQLTYMEYEKSFPISFSNTKINNEFALGIKAWWNMVNATMGGPFISYTFLDKKNNRVIMVDAFVFAPNFRKRNFIKELDAIVQSIQVY